MIIGFLIILASLLIGAVVGGMFVILLFKEEISAMSPQDEPQPPAGGRE